MNKLEPLHINNIFQQQKASNLHSIDWLEFPWLTTSITAKKFYCIRPTERGCFKRRLDICREGQHWILILARRDRVRILHPQRGHRSPLDEEAKSGIDNLQFDKEAPHDGLKAQREFDAVLKNENQDF